jgi:hypothetical protein
MKRPIIISDNFFSISTQTLKEHELDARNRVATVRIRLTEHHFAI